MARDRPMIRNVVFDVGNVLLPLDYRAFLTFLTEAGVDLSDMPGWLARIGLEAHERGELRGEAFLERLASTSGRQLDLARLRRAWLDMFDEAPEMFALATGLKSQYRVYLLSNIGDLHWDHLAQRYGLEGLVHGALASFRAGVIKPQAAIFREAERLFGLEPAGTVFIDDLSANVRGAEACGWHGINHVDPATTRAALRRLGVRVPAGSAED
jgi:HAD superfamily hydrolase (TIGR01509 family)